MIRNKDIIDEYDKRIRKVSTEVTFPLEDKYKKFIEDAIEMLTLSQIEEEAKKYDLRPGMGLSAIQVGIDKRIFVIVYEYEEGKFENYIFINPKLISQSEEMIYVDGGEGCLSINREIEGIVPRSARIRAEYYDMDGNKQTIRLREELSIAFQHELDHLNGKLFYDRIDKKNPFKNQNSMRAI
ncbi:MAG: peptide deformylase [Bacilli bacterium]|nr:peptide deformylase [Bacilli bacterium]